MSFQEERYYKIEAYLSGELDAGERIAFENQISTDDLLKAELEKHKVANALIVEQRLMSVKNILQEEKLKDSNTNTSFKPFGFILIAAVTVGIGASVWMLTKTNTTAVSVKDVNKNAQTASSAERSENKSPAENKDHVIKEATHSIPSEDIGFHKQQIQQIEKHLHADEKGVLHIDSSFVVKSADVKSSANVVNISPVSFDKTTVPVDPCSNIVIQGTVKTSASCSHDATGTIFIQNIQGGKKPYSITLSSSNNDAVTNGQLVKGVYTASVKDANGCVQNYSNISVEEKECPRDYSFNPFYGNEEWEIEPQSLERKLEIYDKGGVLYFQRTIPAFASYKWSGMGTGNQVVPGYYIFVMKYADGTIKKGSVTIVQ